jgi:hypothetical protein
LQDGDHFWADSAEFNELNKPAIKDLFDKRMLVPELFLKNKYGEITTKNICLFRPCPE